MIEKYTYSGEDFSVVMEYEGWKIGFLRYSERFSRFEQLERHLETDEAFVLISGEATLYTESEVCKMKKCFVYNIPYPCHSGGHTFAYFGEL